jgi:hypothetical protein
MRRPREIKRPLRSRHRHIQKAALLGDNVLATAHKRFQHGRRQFEPRRAARLRQPPFDEARNEHGLELQSFGLVDRHDLDRVGETLDLGRPLILLR